MKIKRGKYEIEIKTLRNQQRPSLLILADRNLHSKVGMMMDDQRAEEFMQYLAKMYGGATCPACGGQLIWQSDFTFEDCGYDGDGIVTMYVCAQCGADVETAVRIGESE